MRLANVWAVRAGLLVVGVAGGTLVGCGSSDDGGPSPPSRRGRSTPRRSPARSPSACASSGTSRPRSPARRRFARPRASTSSAGRRPSSGSPSSPSCSWTTPVACRTRRRRPARRAERPVRLTPTGGTGSRAAEVVLGGFGGSGVGEGVGGGVSKHQASVRRTACASVFRCRGRVAGPRSADGVPVPMVAVRPGGAVGPAYGVPLRWRGPWRRRAEPCRIAPIPD